MEKTIERTINKEDVVNNDWSEALRKVLEEMFDAIENDEE